MLRKSQVTVFIIIVLVIMVMFGITYYIIGLSAEQAAEESIVRQQIGAEKIEPFNEYVKSCLSLASSEGLELLGKQGGYIYKSQGGMYEDPLPAERGKEFIDYEGTKVHYGIYAPKADVGTVFFATTPKYPWPTFPEVYHPVTGELGNPEYLEGYYGRNKLPPFERPKENSIQEQLEEFTISGVITCIDWATFTQQGLNISAGQPNVSVVFAEADMTFNLDWPITITDLGTGAVTDMREFIVIYPVRMRKIYDFAALVMDKDVGNISFDIKASDGIISAQTAEDVFGNDDLIMIRDTESMVLGTPYEFRFMRQNRPPALYYIHPIEDWICNTSLVQSVPPNRLNVVNSCGDNIVLNFTTLDPDEDNVEITFSKPLPYELDQFDVYARNYSIEVRAGDGQYTDTQQISFDVRST